MVVSFPKLRKFIGALVSLLFIGGVFCLYDFCSEGGYLGKYLSLAMCVLLGGMFVLLPLIKKRTRLAFRFDGFAFVFLLLPLAYITLCPEFINVKNYVSEYVFEITGSMLVMLKVALGYALFYTFFENTTKEYEKGVKENRSANRKLRKERKKNRQEKKTAAKEKKNAAKQQKKNQKAAAKQQKVSQKEAKKAAKASKEAAKHAKKV